MPPSGEGRPLMGFQAAEQTWQVPPSGMSAGWVLELCPVRDGWPHPFCFRVLSALIRWVPLGSPALFLLHQSEAEGRKLRVTMRLSYSLRCFVLFFPHQISVFLLLSERKFSF